MRVHVRVCVHAHIDTSCDPLPLGKNSRPYTPQLQKPKDFTAGSNQGNRSSLVLSYEWEG